MDNTITFQQSVKAWEYVRSFMKRAGFDEENIDWDNKPKNLPEPVSEAWDIYVKFQDQMEKSGVDY